MRFSFIIPTKNEGKYLEECLLSIKNQSLKNYEIIVVDTNSTDRTKAIARKYGTRVINEPRTGPGIARNTGAKVARGAILVFCDADVHFDHYFLEKLEEKFRKEKDIGGCIFRLRTYDARKKSHEVAYKYVNSVVEFMNKIGIAITAGSCFAFRRDVFFKAGSFNERFLTNEDHDLAQRVSKIKRFMFFNDIVIETSSRRIKKFGLLRSLKIYVKSTLIYLLNKSYLRDYW